MMMSNWNFRSVGTFDNEADVDKYARDNRINPADMKTRKGRDGRVEAEVRESAYDDSSNDVFGGYDRKSGFR
jgi:hypothetical protein